MPALATGGSDQSLNPVVATVMAAQLSHYARQRGDAMAMMIAADLMQDVKLARTVAGMDAPGTPGKDIADALPNAANLYTEAKALAQGRTDFLAIIKEAEQSGSRGVVGTVDTQVGRLGGKESKIFEFTFSGDSDAAAGVTIPGAKPALKSGVGDADLDLYVYDDKGAPVCISESAGMPELCRWTPRRSGTFKIKLENRLNSAADYALIVK